MNGTSLLYVNNRLQSRRTLLEWDKTLMGPIDDEIGLEQGGISSGDQYKVYNSSQVQSSQSSRLGVPLGPEHVASIAQADDVALCSNDIFNLQCLLNLTVDYCSKYSVELSSEKTKMIAFFDSRAKDDAEYAMDINPVVLNRKPVDLFLQLIMLASLGLMVGILKIGMIVLQPRKEQQAG